MRLWLTYLQKSVRINKAVKEPEGSVGRTKRLTDEELLAKARDHFIQKGSRASTREIAKEAGISESVIYQRFPTKDRLFFAAMTPPPMDVESLLKSLPPDGDTLLQLEAIAIRMMDYFREIMPVLLQLVTHPRFDMQVFSEGHPDSAFENMHDGIMYYLRKLVSRDVLREDQLAPTATILFATFHNLAFLERLGLHGGSFPEEEIRTIVRTLWYGIGQDERQD
ncbi:TetR/AcrR family transcriptional regulator [bacterium]|nr:TetR/AcrR family transcriptional regulator [bacterium]